MIQGSIVALVTPMTSKDEIDKKAFCDLLEYHIANGTNSIGISGATGESATLSHQEFLDLIKLANEVVKKRVPIIAGTGTSSTKVTIEKTKEAVKLGADACLIVAPYYNRPTQEGLYLHYKTIAENVNVPIVLYNVPTRTGCDILPETIVRLSYLKHIVAVKEATGDLERLKLLQQNCDRGFKFYSGDDPTCLEFMLMGGHGVISITANIAPKLMSAMCNSALHSKDIIEAKRINKILENLHKLCMIEPNPIPVKWALYKMQLIQDSIRLPLTTLTAVNQEKVEIALIKAGIITR